MRYIVVIVVLVIAGFIYSNVQKRKECDDRALAAAVNTYPINEYPDTNQREILQRGYQDKYKESC